MQDFNAVVIAVGKYNVTPMGPPFLAWIPKNTTLVGEIKHFLLITITIQSGCVDLKNDTILMGINTMILATGFRYSLPFLPQYYDDATYDPHECSAKMVLIFLPLDGSHIRTVTLGR
ncbi:hypothetical protein EV363DRAFT_1447304 [Boletus edulis]|nr:hypothetical protein EV363DRAFT_1447304 [Boletus edulis]